jgi:hypothetical protein
MKISELYETDFYAWTIEQAHYRPINPKTPPDFSYAIPTLLFPSEEGKAFALGIWD